MTAKAGAADGRSWRRRGSRAGATVVPRALLTLGTLIGASLAPLGCRSGGGAAPPKSAEITLNEVTEERPAPPKFERLRLTRSEDLEGFDLDGLQSCLPLAKDARCLERHDVVADACLQAHGRILRCEDCRILCTVVVAVVPTTAAGGRP